MFNVFYLPGKHRNKDHSPEFIPERTETENGFESSPSLSSLDEMSEGGYGDGVTSEGVSGESNNTSPSHTHNTSRGWKTSPEEVVLERISQGDKLQVTRLRLLDNWLSTRDEHSDPSVSSEHLEPSVSGEHLESRVVAEYVVPNVSSKTEQDSTLAPVEDSPSNDEHTYGRVESNTNEHSSGVDDQGTADNIESSTIQEDFHKDDNYFQDREAEAAVSVEDVLDEPLRPYPGQPDVGPSVEDCKIEEIQTLDSVVDFEEPLVLSDTGNGNTGLGNGNGSQQQVVPHTHIVSTEHSKMSYAENNSSTNPFSKTEPDQPLLKVDNEQVSPETGDELKEKQLTEPVRMTQVVKDESVSLSVVSRDTIVDDDSPLEVSSEKEVRSSRDSTPKRRGTNPFLNSDSEDEFDLRSRGTTGTNPFADSDHEDVMSDIPHPSQTHTSSTQVQAHNRPLSFQIPPPPPGLPSNPFFDDVTDDKTPLCEKQPETVSQDQDLNLPLSDFDSLTVSMDTPTISRHLPSLDGLNSSDQSLNLPDQFQNQSSLPSSETTPSISPLSFLNDTKERYLPDDVDTESYASSQDLSVILEGAWGQVQCPSPLGSPTHLSPMEDHFRAEVGSTV